MKVESAIKGQRLCNIIDKLGKLEDTFSTSLDRNKEENYSWLPDMDYSTWEFISHEEIIEINKVVLQAIKQAKEQYEKELEELN